MKVRALPGQSLRHGAPTVRRLAARPPRAQPGVSGSDAGGPVPPLEALPLPEGSLGLPLVGETLELLKDGEGWGRAQPRLSMHPAQKTPAQTRVFAVCNATAGANAPQRIATPSPTRACMCACLPFKRQATRLAWSGLGCTGPCGKQTSSG